MSALCALRAHAAAHMQRCGAPLTASRKRACAARDMARLYSSSAAPGAAGKPNGCVISPRSMPSLKAASAAMYCPRAKSAAPSARARDAHVACSSTLPITWHSGAAAAAALAACMQSARPSEVAARAPRRWRGRSKLGSMLMASMQAAHASRRRPSAASAAAELLTYDARRGPSVMALR
jgi:hypothetical protein